MWVLLSGESLIGPGIRYGDRPAGTVTQVPAHPVTAGLNYVVAFTAERGASPIAALTWKP